MRGGFFQLAQSTAQFGICASLPCHQHPPYRCSCNSDDGYIFRSHTAIILHLSPALACGRRQWHLLSGSKLTHARFAYVTRAGNTVSQCLQKTKPIRFKIGPALRRAQKACCRGEGLFQHLYWNIYPILAWVEWGGFKLPAILAASSGPRTFFRT